MIVLSTPRAALSEPKANITVRTRLRVGILQSLTFVAFLLQAIFHPAVVRRIFLDPIGIFFEILALRHHMHKLWFDALRLLQQLRIKRELQNSGGLSLARQLAVVNLIRPSSKPAR